MKLLKSGLVFILILIYTISCAQEKYSAVKIYAASLAERNELIGLLQVDHFVPEKKAFITEISEQGVARLRARNVRFDILIDDVAANLEKQNRKYFADRAAGIQPEESRVAFEQGGKTVAAIIKQPAAFEVKPTFGGYYSFAEMNTAMNNLVAAYPTIASKVSIGKTAGKRDIWLIKISDNVGADELNEPEVLYMGLQHAREAITGASMIFFMQYLCENYASDARIKNLVDNRELYIIPCFNPDGWEYNRTTATGTTNNPGGGWRKNRRYDSTITITSTPGKRGAPTTYDTTVSYSYYGVDLNRNWGIDWGNCSAPILGNAASCGTNVKSDDTYYGPSAFSELENQAVRAFTQSHHLVAGFDQHAYGPYYSLPFGRKSTGHTMSQKDKDFYVTIPALMGTYNGMRAADSYDALGYEVAGGFKDWMLIGDIKTGTKDTVWAMTGEGAAGGGSSYAGTYSSFWAPAAQIVYLSKGMCYQNLQLAYAAGTYVDVQDGNNIALTAKTGNASFVLQRIGLGNEPVKVTLVPLENVQTVGTPVTVTSMLYNQRLTGSIPYTLPSGLVNGQRVRYAWKIEAGNNTYADTIVKFYNPQVLFSDDMEGSNVATNWTVSAGWNYATDRAYAGTKALTESPGANYTANLTRTATLTRTLDLTNASASYLTFWTRYRAENFRDKLQVQASANGGAWTPLVGKYTIQEPGTVDGSTINGQPALTGVHDYWSQEVFDLSGYNGTANLGLRFSFTSDGDASSFKYEVDEGFFIDNLSVIKSTTTFGTLPLTVSNFGGKLQPGNAVKLAWDAVADKELDYFAIERSADGASFKPIGTVAPSAGYTFTDKAPNSNANFYRLRLVDKNGRVSYSNVIRIVLPQTVTVHLAPNPVYNKVSISIANPKSEPLQLTITDLQGRVMYSQAQTLPASGNIQVDMHTWPPQVYILKVTNQNNGLLAMHKVIKL